MEWKSEAAELPVIAQSVLLAVPRQFGEFWDLKVAQILVRHEGVIPKPIPLGSRWPVDFWWSTGRGPHDTNMVTGNSWWAPLDEIPLPPGAEHKIIRGYHIIAQPTSVWVGAPSTTPSERG